MGFSKSRANWMVHSNTTLPQEARDKSNKNITLHLKQPEKEKMKNPSVSRMKEVIKIRGEINEQKQWRL